MVSVSAEAVVGAIGRERIDEGSAASEWRVLPRLEKTAIGARAGGGVTTVRRSEPAGCLLYGPYWQLPSGTYQLNFRCRSGRPRMPSQPVLGLEVIALNRIQLAWRDLTADELGAEEASLEFVIPAVLGLGAGDEARLEFRFYHMGNADLAITAVDLRSVEEPPPTAAKTWRMLGRLEKTAIGRRTGEGVRVRQTERAGCIIEPGRPYLELPRGHYRLSLRCDAGTPRMASQPVLGLEVAAWISLSAAGRWRDHRPRRWGLLHGRQARVGFQQGWRDFTAAELAAGSGSIEFAVPPELSLEGGEEALFGFRLYHFGNADLTIRAIDLRQLESEEAAPPALRRWRLSGRLAPSATGRRQGDGAVIRQIERAGCLPDLRLPSGRYRLSFCCRAGAPRNASQPVLAVEVVAPTRLLDRAYRGWRSLLRPRFLRQARREFTSEELRAGSGAIEFAVPAELSLEGEDDTRFEFKFLHLGNADVTIGAVELREAIPENTAPPRHRSHSPRTLLRKRLVIIGNCQAQTIYEALLRTREFNVRLDTRYHFVGLQQNLHEIGKGELERCDILMVQDIKDWENYPLRSHIREDLPIVKFPLLHFASLWPFDHYNGPGDKEAYDHEWPNLTFLYLDGLLARLRKNIPDPEQRRLAYRSLAVDGIVNFVRLHDFEKRRLLAMDKQFGFDIGRFILENFRQSRLFHTTNHPNGEITAMLMRYLLRHLEIDEAYRPIASLDHLKKLQVPVHPKVAEALGVKWANDKTRYLYGGERITWEIYVRRYIEHYG
jgi:hypothetical protein